MRCLTDCGYQESPESLPILTRHVESCSVAHPASDKKVVWRNGQFEVTTTVTEEDTVIEHTFRTFEVPPFAKSVIIPSQTGRPVTEEEPATSD